MAIATHPTDAGLRDEVTTKLNCVVYVVSDEPDAFRAAMDAVTTRFNGNDVQLDLRNVRYLSSADLNRIIAAHLRFESTGHRLVLVGVSVEVYEILQITRLNRILRIDSPDVFPPQTSKAPPSRLGRISSLLRFS